MTPTQLEAHAEAVAAKCEWKAYRTRIAPLRWWYRRRAVAARAVAASERDPLAGTPSEDTE
jgi:hypothetical protein